MGKSEKNKTIVIIEIIIVFIAMLFAGKIAFSGDKKNDNPTVTSTPTPVSTPKEIAMTGNFNIDIIKGANTYANKSNYLISPYNIEIALNMLREGADGKSKEEIDQVITNREIKDVSVENKINIANGVFIKNKYKNSLKNDLMNTLKNKYQSEVLYDEFETPKVINDWVNKKTNGMIDKVVDNIEENFILGLASALAIDVKWQNSFDCYDTKSEEFTKIDNSKINTEMMHKTYENNAKYIKTDDVEGIVIPYNTGSDIELEFVGLLPNNVDEYINNLTNEKLTNLFSNLKAANDKLHINLSLPRFTYDYDFEKFMDTLKNMGIKEVFDEAKANLHRMVDEEAYVGVAIHKTHIELNELGTKAAAITYFGIDAKGAVIKDYEEVDVKFNKPFIYMIRERNSGEILCFGSVYEPNIWNGKTCSNEG